MKTEKLMAEVKMYATKNGLKCCISANKFFTIDEIKDALIVALMNGVDLPVDEVIA